MPDTSPEGAHLIASRANEAVHAIEAASIEEGCTDISGGVAMLETTLEIRGTVCG